MSERIAHAGLRGKVMTADEAAAFINPGDMIGFSGFTGASTAPELDAALAETGGIAWRMPYQSDPSMRKAINDGTSAYSDIHLSHSGPQTEQGFFGDLNVAVVEATRITESGGLVPTSSVGNNVSYLNAADKIIVEVNSWQSLGLEGMHDIWSPGLPPNRQIVPIIGSGQRVGTTAIEIDPSKVVAVIETNAADRNSPFKPLDDDSKAIAGHLIDFFENEVSQGRLPENLLPLQSGVGNIANAVLAGLLDSDFENLTSYTEVIQDGMVELLDKGTMTVASATSFALSPEAAERMNDQAEDYAKKIVLRPQDVSNNPEVIRRLGVISCNGLIEADIYGNVNSTHIMGTKIMNGIGGSGDFTRNGFISSFITPSLAKDGAISAIVPLSSTIRRVAFRSVDKRCAIANVVLSFVSF